MFGPFLLSLPLIAASAEWRSQEFLKARAEVDRVRDTKGGIAVIVEIKRMSSTVIKGVAEVRGHGSWVLSWAPRIEPPTQAKPEPLVKWNLDESFALARPIPIEFSAPSDLTAATFFLNSNDFGGLEWPKTLPAYPGGSVVMVFYIPKN